MEGSKFKWGLACVTILCVLGEHVQEGRDGDPLQEPEGAGISASQHVHHPRGQ